MSRSVTVVIDKQGNGKVEMNDFQGQGCDALAEVLRRSIGGTVNEQNKPEYYESNTNENTVSL